MPKFTCVFVEEDKETIVEGAVATQIESDLPENAAFVYRENNYSIGPFVSVRDENGHDLFFKVDDYTENPKERDKWEKDCARKNEQANEWLKKIWWSLVAIWIILILWHVFGWVVKPT